MMSIIIVGKEFKKLVSAVTLFPSIGSFGGSELVNLHVKGGWATATTFGVVLSMAKVPATGELSLLGINERDMKSVASICTDADQIRIDVDKHVTIHFRGREIITPLSKGTAHTLPAIEDPFNVSKEVADKLTYLARVAFGDSSKPELCGVLLAGGGRAMACSQKAIAVLDYNGSKVANRVALPVPLAKILKAGDVVSCGAKETVVKRGRVWYCMPSPVRAQKEFPVEQVLAFEKTVKDPLVTCSGVKLAMGFDECQVCLSNVSKNEVKVLLTVADGKLALSSENGGVKFKTVVKAAACADGEVMIPLEEMLLVGEFVGEQHDIEITRGRKNGEVFIAFNGGWAMFPAYTTPKKKRRGA